MDRAAIHAALSTQTALPSGWLRATTTWQGPTRIPPCNSIQYAPGTGPRPLQRQAHTFGATKGLWAAEVTDDWRYLHCPTRQLEAGHWASKAATGATRRPRHHEPTRRRANRPKRWERSDSARGATTNLKLTCQRRENEGTWDEWPRSRLASEAEAITNLKLDRRGKLRRGKVVNRSGSPLGVGCNSDTTTCGSPRQVRPAAFKFDSDESERAGREVKRQEQPPPKPERVWPTGLPATPHHPTTLTWRHPLPRPGSSPCPATAKDAQICNKAWFWASRPYRTATRSGTRARTCQICLVVDLYCISAGQNMPCSKLKQIVEQLTRS